jgi:hypothetical protein
MFFLLIIGLRIDIYEYGEYKDIYRRTYNYISPWDFHFVHLNCRTGKKRQCRTKSSLSALCILKDINEIYIRHSYYLNCICLKYGVRVMVFNATFNNILVISWRSVLLVEETGEPGENHWPVTSHWQTLSHNVVSSTPRHERDSNSKL